MRLDVKAFALTCAILWGLGLFLATWWILGFEGPAAPGARPPFLGLIYRGYSVSPLGSVLGLAWGFADGLAGGALFAWLYNRLANREPTR